MEPTRGVWSNASHSSQSIIPPPYSSLALSGDWLAIGIPTRANPGVSTVGAVELRHRNQGGADEWGFVTRILNTESRPETPGFGSSVALSGQDLAIHAYESVEIYHWVGPALDLWARDAVVALPGDHPGPIRLKDGWLATVAAGAGPGPAEAYERTVILRHRDAAAPRSWGRAQTHLLPNHQSFNVAFDARTLLHAVNPGFQQAPLVIPLEAFDQAMTVSIRDDDPAPVITGLADASGIEGSGTVQFHGTAQSRVQGDVTVTFEVVPDSARPGVDYVNPIVGTATLMNSLTEFRFGVDLVQDTVPEPPRSFTVRLTGISRGKLVATSARGSILDDDVDLRHRTIFLPLASTVSAHVPTAATYALPWRTIAFDDSGWLQGQQGVGYERDPTSPTSYSRFIGLDVGAGLYNINSSLLVRAPFTLPAPVPTGGAWVLRARVDDGLVVWANGTEIFRLNSPGVLAWDSQATSTPVETQTFPPVTALLPDLGSSFEAGRNMLALHALNREASSSDLLVQAEVSHFSFLSHSYLDWVLAAPGASADNYWPLDDPDEDLASNAHEYLFGTRPRDPASRPGAPLVVTTTETGDIVISAGFAEVPGGAMVMLQRSADLSSGRWTTVAERLAGGPWLPVPPGTLDPQGAITLPLAEGGTQHYFRCLITIETQ